MWAVKLLAVLILAVIPLNWMEVKGNTLRLTPENKPIEVNYPPELNSRGIRHINRYGTTKTQLCGRRLLETIMTVCKSPLGRRSRMWPQVQTLHQTSSTTSTLLNRDRRENSEEDVESERFEDLQEEEIMDQLNLFRHKKRSTFTEELPRDVVEECCNKAHQGCSPSQLVKYCVYLHLTPEKEMTTPTLTTTTTPVPPQFRSHRLIRMKTERPIIGPRAKKANGDSSSSTTVEEIRQQIIHEAIQCLFNPDCYKVKDSDEIERNIILPPPQLSNTLSQTSRFPNSNRFLPSGKIKSGNKNIPSSSKSKTSPHADMCHSAGSKPRSKSRRLHRRRKQEQETSRLIPLILQILAWYTNVSPLREPEVEDAVIKPSPHMTQPDTNSTSNGDDANYGPFIRPSDSSLNPTNVTTGRKKTQTDFLNLGDRKSQMVVYTEAPLFQSNSRYVQFPLGTNDGLTFGR